MLRAINAPAQEAFDILDEFGDKSSAREQLKRFGEAYLHFFLAPDSLEITRLAISEGRNGELGALMYRESVLQGWKKVADFFEERFADLPSHFCDFSEVAMSYRALLSADLTEQMLRGVLKKVDLQTIRAKSHFSATVICDLFK
ncbi:TetR/AcrR family transcriptional regulator C-terminal domain-containing protein [Raoultella ornithinolytica]|nr:TetR/AcrR family transcriptional regulator C-terminal domain-containing protein [Raoultella ornithinolytica]